MGEIQWHSSVLGIWKHMKLIMFWLVVCEPEKYESVGMMTFPINMESHKIHVPNHQPVFVCFFFRSRASWRWTSSSSTRAKGECFIFAAAFKMRRWPAAQPKVPCKQVKDLEKFFRKNNIEKTIQKLSNHGMFDDFCIPKLFFLCAKKQFGMTLDRFCNSSGWFPMILGLCLKDSRILVLGTVIDRTLNLSCQTKAVHPLRKSCPVIPPLWCRIREGFVTEKLKQPINTPHGPWTMITYEYPPCRLNPSKLSLSSPCFKRKGHVFVRALSPYRYTWSCTYRNKSA